MKNRTVIARNTAAGGVTKQSCAGRMVTLASGLCLLASVVSAEEIYAATQWVRQPANVSVASLVDKGGVVVGHDAVGLQNSRSLLVTYVQLAKDIYRCIDYLNVDLSPAGFACYKGGL